MVIQRTIAELWQFNGFSKWWQSAIFDSLKFDFKNCKYSSQGQCESSNKSSWRLVKPLLRYGNASIFQNGGHPAAWIF